MFSRHQPLLLLLGLLLFARPSLAEEGLAIEQAASVEPLSGHLDGVGMVQLAQPALGHKPSFNGMLQLDAGFELPAFEVMLLPRLRVADFAHTKQTTELFFQQAYATLHALQWRLKVGRVLGQFGRIWDYGLYGPLLAGTDVKLTPDIGLSLEGLHGEPDSVQLFFAAQYFLVDGKAFSFHNPEFFSLRYARRRHISSVRVQPSVPLGAGRLSVAANAQHFHSVREQMRHVWRAALDVDYSQPGFDAFAEVGQQWGTDLASDDQQLVGRHAYLWAGLQKSVGPVLLRHHVNLVLYARDSRWLDILHQPGAEWMVNKHLSLIAEGAVWHNAPNVRGRGEFSLFFVVLGKT